MVSKHWSRKLLESVDSLKSERWFKSLLALKEFTKMAFWVRSFGRIRVRISDPGSLTSWRSKGTELWFVGSVTMTIGAKSLLSLFHNLSRYGKIAAKRSLKQTSKFKITSNNISSNVTKQAVPPWRLHVQVLG